MTSKKVLALVLAGGRDPRLHPLTINHSKSSIVFCGHRLVDFVLGNLVNSGIESIYVLAECHSESLIEHIHANWSFAETGNNRFISVTVPKNGHAGCYRGAVDALCHNIHLIEQQAPDMVAVFGADQVYRMDVRQMVEHHLHTGAEVTVAATRVPIEQAPSYGVIVKGCDDEIWDFQEKPDNPVPLPHDAGQALASMGNYLFNTEVLLASLKEAAQFEETEADLGQYLLPGLLPTRKVCCYDFSSNRIPGIKPHEKPDYWRVIGSLEAYVDAAQDISGKRNPLRLNNPHWPVLPLKRQPPPANADRTYSRLSRVDLMQMESRLLYQ